MLQYSPTVLYLRVLQVAPAYCRMLPSEDALKYSIVKTLLLIYYVSIKVVKWQSMLWLQYFQKIDGVNAGAIHTLSDTE